MTPSPLADMPSLPAATVLAHTATAGRVATDASFGTPTRPTLRISHLDHAFGPRQVLEDISLQVPAGRTVALVGPSGCGKSTLLHLCAGLLTPRTGEIDNGFERTAMLFQQPHLLPWKTTLDNIALGLKAKGMAARARKTHARAMGHALGLDEMALAQFPHQLSGGMQSRAALARALVMAPKLLLLDEPFAALDIGLRAQMHQLLLAQQQQQALSVLMITHDIHEAITLADSVLVMAARPGRLVWRIDLPRPAHQRDEDWISRHAAALLAQPVVRAAFELPPLPDTPSAGPAPTATTGQGGNTPIDAGLALEPPGRSSHRSSRC